MASLGGAAVARQLSAAGGAAVLVIAALRPGPVGWLAGLAYTAGLVWLLASATRRAGEVTLGPAGLVTLARAVLVGGVTALVADGLMTGHVPVPALVGLAGVALLLDAVDGQVARRTGTATALGARFDMEVDAALLMVLSVQAAHDLGPWVLAIGLMRYGYVAASWVRPWLAGSLPPLLVTKAIAALQGIALVVAVSGVLPRPGATLLVAGSLALLTWSFAHHVQRLRRARAAAARTIR
ncbi:Phosphatidylglycerophosphate synthase [Pseudonocardia thermophila]|jgi:Phosphatidylglycerophosphate synthase|uniref:Phosphatidylglycerophosphate synthase n=1 Tax=Pseudonocardia thermophila TaxID=1848 RepID=A0A1M6T5B0_PSETH|nr:CDP-alcohol phosphatidyltransferase family protein [Pseudonocardia thermophila]SHK52056.1 Phosphatidylglycerophosphate synthase [Pseudonocardia thermophila]